MQKVISLKKINKQHKFQQFFLGTFGGDGGIMSSLEELLITRCQSSSILSSNSGKSGDGGTTTSLSLVLIVSHVHSSELLQIDVSGLLEVDIVSHDHPTSSVISVSGLLQVDMVSHDHPKSSLISVSELLQLDMVSLLSLNKHKHSHWLHVVDTTLGILKGKTTPSINKHHAMLHVNWEDTGQGWTISRLLRQAGLNHGSILSSPAATQGITSTAFVFPSTAASTYNVSTRAHRRGPSSLFQQFILVLQPLPPHITLQREHEMLK